MAEDIPVNSGIPPKLDLKKNGALKSPVPVQQPVQPVPAPAIPGLSRQGQSGGATVVIKRPVITSVPRPTLSQQQPTTLPPPAPVAPPQPAAAEQQGFGKGSSSTLFIQLPSDGSVSQTSSLEAKKKTSRIPLEAAMAMPATSDTQTVRTVRIRPAIQSAQTEAKAPVGIQQPPPAPGTPADPKRKTSRISLDAAIAINEKGAADGGEGPKTIRLKKPGDMSTVKLQPPSAGGTVSVPASVPAAANPGATTPLDVTTTLEDLAPEESGQTPTKRKTIKVKRPGQGGEQSGEVTAGGAPEMRRSSIAVAVAPAVVEDSPHWLFVTAGSIAAVVAIAVCLVVASQAIGPNSCGTYLSDFPTAWDINLPGLQKIAPPPR